MDPIIIDLDHGTVFGMFTPKSLIEQRTGKPVAGSVVDLCDADGNTLMDEDGVEPYAVVSGLLQAIRWLRQQDLDAVDPTPEEDDGDRGYDPYDNPYRRYY